MVLKRSAAIAGLTALAYIGAAGQTPPLIAGKTPPKLQPAKEGEQIAMVPGDRGQMNFQGLL